MDAVLSRVRMWSNAERDTSTVFSVTFQYSVKTAKL